MKTVFIIVAIAIFFTGSKINAIEKNSVKAYNHTIGVFKTALLSKKAAITHTVKRLPSIQFALIETEATITAYSAVETCSTHCIMASGNTAYVGAAACPRSIPLGKVVTIDGIGEFICEDRTATRVDGRFDLFFGYSQEDYNRAIAFGKQQRRVQYDL